MDLSQLYDKIANIRSQLDKEIHDVVYMVQQKHVEFLPQTMFLPIQFAVEQAITRVNASVNELQGVAAEPQLWYIKESPRKQLDFINAILSKLDVIKEFEDLYVEINSDNMLYPVDLANVIVKCQEYLKSLAGKDVYEPLKKVLPGLSHSFDFRKGDIVRRFNNRFLDMIHYPSTGGKNYLQLFVSRNKIGNFNKELEAMRILGLLDEHLEHFASETLNNFVARVLDSRAPQDNLVIFKVFPDNYSFVIKKNITKADKIDPLKIFEILTTFFSHLHQCFESFAVNKIPLVQYLGNKFSTKLTEMIIKDCLTASVPNDDTEKDAYQTVIETANKFHRIMQEYGFFEPNSPSFEAFAERFDQIFVNRRCTKIIVAARNYIFNHSVDTVEVGTSEDERDDSPETLIKELALTSQIREDKFPNNSHLPKVFQFSKCKISKSIYELGELLINTLEAAASAEQDFAAGRLLTTAHNIIKLYLMGAEKQHHDTITSIPMFAALFYNECYYLCHLTMMSSLRLQTKITKGCPVFAKECNFAPYFAELRQQAADALEYPLLQARRQISSVIGVDDIFLNLGIQNERKECHRIVDGCIRQIQQIATVWKDVLTDSVYVRALGSLVAYTLSIFTKMVLSKKDITEVDAEEIKKELAILLKAFEDLMKISGQQTIQALCEADYHKTKEIIFCLRESLLNISDRWCEGKGPLAHWLKADQLKQLIRALFQNTDRRAQVLENIN